MSQNKQIRGQTLHREARLEARDIDEEARTVELAFSSEEPVERYFGMEVLEHRNGAARLDRLNSGGAVLMNHDTTDQIGVVESARVDQDKRGRAVIRFSRSTRAEEVFQDVRDGIRSLVSVGYRIHGEEIERGEADAPDTVRITDWEPLELSFVAVPADATVGVGRDLDVHEGADAPTLSEAPAPDVHEEDTRMTTTTDAPEATVDETPNVGAEVGTITEQRGESEVTERSAARVRTDEQIRSLGQRFGCDDLAEDHVALSSSVEDVQAAIRSALNARSTPLPIRQGARIEEVARYRAKPQLMRAFGRETRVAEERAYTAGMWARAVIFGDAEAARWWTDKRGTRALGGGIFSKGGATVPTEMEDAIIDLREQYGVARRLCRVVPMSGDTLTVPRVTGNSTATWTGENVDLTAADPAFDGVELVAKKLTSLTRVSAELVEDSVIDIGAFLARDKAWAFAKKEDEAWIDGDGTSTYGGIYGLRPKIIDGNHTAGAIDGASGIDTLPEVTADDLDNVRAALPEYVMNPVWLMSKAAKNVGPDALARAAGGNTVENIGGALMSSYLGDEIVVSQAMPKGTGTDYSNVAMMFYGAFDQSSTIGDRRGMSVQVLTELYSASDQIGIKTTGRCAIVNHDLGDTSDAGPVVALIGE